MTRADQLAQVEALVEQIRPLLARRAPEVQGAALADCLAIWLAGHHVAGDEHATGMMRLSLIAHHVARVWELTAVNAKIMGTTQGNISLDLAKVQEALDGDAG